MAVGNADPSAVRFDRHVIVLVCSIDQAARGQNLDHRRVGMAEGMNVATNPQFCWSRYLV